MANNNVTYLENIDEQKMTELLEQTETNVEYFNKVTRQVSQAYSTELDELVRQFMKRQSIDKELPMDYLESTYMKLSSILYFMGDQLEQLGIHNDMSKAAKQEIYNKAYLANQIKDSDKKNKTTVAENIAVAEQQSQYETIVNSIYDRAYKMLKYKIDAGFELLNTLRKIITRRMQEVDLSANQRNTAVKVIRESEDY